MARAEHGWRWTAAAGTLAVVAYVGAWAWALQGESYNIWGSLLLVPVVIAVNVPLVGLGGPKGAR